jgi:lipopolysaccharide/colanic/teichoic acid biosynthesis glycosyltransferase
MSAITSKKLPRKAHHAVVTPAYHTQAADLLCPSRYFAWKGGMDRTLALLLLVPGLPIIGLLLLLVRMTSRGSGIYRQVRIGQHGRKFTMYKIRTMCQNAERASGPVWTQTHDPRITVVGRVLRRLHLDELPQLINILKGEMSLIGPRPERPEFVHVLADAIPGYMNRLVVRPGVTGLAQLNLPPDSDLDSVHRKLALDCEYIAQASFWLDLRLFACTFCRMLRLPEGWLLRAFGIARSVPSGGLSRDAAGAEHSGATEPTAVTPAIILMDAVSGAANASGRSSSHHEHHSKRHHPTAGHGKPR